MHGCAFCTQCCNVYAINIIFTIYIVVFTVKTLYTENAIHTFYTVVYTINTVYRNTVNTVS